MYLIKWATILLLVYLKSAEVEQLILYLMHFNCSEVHLKIYVLYLLC